MVVGLASGVPGPLVFVLLMTVACHHRDDAVRPPVGVARSPRTRAAALGWDGRMLVVAAGSALHAPVPVYGILAGYLAVLLVTEAVRTWSATPVADVLPAGTVPEDGAGPGHPRPAGNPRPDLRRRLLGPLVRVRGAPAPAVPSPDRVAAGPPPAGGVRPVRFAGSAVLHCVCSAFDTSQAPPTLLTRMVHR